MAQQIINVGSANNAGDGEAIRQAFIKSNANFEELYLQSGHASYTDTAATDISPFVLAANTDTILPINGVTVYDSEKPVDIDSFYISGGLDLSAKVGSFILGEEITSGLVSATIIRQDTNTIEYLGNVGNFVTSTTVTGSTSGATATISALRSGYITGRNNDNLDVMLYFKAEPSSVDQWLDVWLNIGGAVGELYRQTFSFPKGIGVERGVLYALPSSYTRSTWEANGGKIYVRSNNTLNIYDINLNLDRSYRAR